MQRDWIVLQSIGSNDNVTQSNVIGSRLCYESHVLPLGEVCRCHRVLSPVEDREAEKEWGGRGGGC